MIPTLLVDIYETDALHAALSKLLIAQRFNLVSMGVGDYYWDNGVRHSLEHKSGDQAVSESGHRLDRQLRTHMQNADVVGLVISNVVGPASNGGCTIWKKEYMPTTGRWRWVSIRDINKPYTAFQGYIWQLQQIGIQVFQFDGRDSMALGIAEFVFNSAKPTHSTLQRHLRPTVNVKRKQVKGWKPNPYIETLMGIRGGMIGEIRATKLIEKFKTPYAVYNAPVQEIFQILGRASALKFLSAIGRY